MSPERAGSPLGMEPRELARTLQSAIPPFKLVRAQLSALQATTISEEADNDLTSLTWLQDNDILKGMNLTCAKSEEVGNVGPVVAIQSIPTTVIQSVPPLVMHRVPRSITPPPSQMVEVVPVTPPQQYNSADQSPTSDYMDESSVSEPTDSSSSSSLNSPVPYSYNTPNSSPSKASSKHPHNIKYDPMIHTFSKPPYSFSSLIFMAIEDSPLKALPVKDIYAWILDHFPYFKNAPTGWKNSVRHNLSLNKCFQKVEKSPNLGKGSLWMVDQQYRPNLLQALTRSPFHPSSTLDPATFRSASSRTSSPFVQMIDKQTSTRLPNPELFPFLSRRLAASEAGKPDIKTEAHSDDESSLDDVHAATAILALKHGSRINISAHHRQKLPSESSDQLTVMPSEMVQVITRSPSEDHTYSSSNHTSVKHEQLSPSRPPSPDEAFESDDSMHSRLNFSSIDLEEQRRIEEGADALLNLAGISTTIRSNNNMNEIDYMTTPLSSKRELIYIKTDNRITPEDGGEEGDDEDQIHSDSGLVREQKFRPRMLRMKRKHHQDPHGNSHQSKRKFVNNNNNNNIVESKLAAKLISAADDDWSNRSNWNDHEVEEGEQILSHNR